MSVDGKGGPAGLDCLTGDLGLGGAFLSTTVALDLGSRVTVEIGSPFSWEPLRLVAEVRRVSALPMAAGLGVEFVELESRQVLALHDLLATLSYGPSG